MNWIPEGCSWDLPIAFDEIRHLEGFGDKSVANLNLPLKTRKQPLHRLIYAFVILYVGETSAKTMTKAFDYLLNFKNNSLE